MIPEFYDGMYLPDGEHEASWDEVHERFGKPTEARQALSRRLKHFLDVAKNCAFIRVYLFGSFISGKEEPGDVDLMYSSDLDFDSLTQQCRELLNYSVIKAREGWDMFCCSDTPSSSPLGNLLEAWKEDRDKKRRGMIVISLQS